jgi:hypothetical protein
MNAIRLLAILLLVLLAPGCGSGQYAQEGLPHAEAIVRSVSQAWSTEKLVEVADPRMLAVFPEPKIREMMTACAQELGRVERQETVGFTTGFETAVSGQVATYMIDLHAEKGNARVTLKLQKVDEKWNVLGFWVQMQGK